MLTTRFTGSAPLCRRRSARHLSSEVDVKAILLLFRRCLAQVTQAITTLELAERRLRTAGLSGLLNRTLKQKPT